MRKFFSIEFLRFLSSLSVLIYHYRLFFNPLNILSEDNYDLTKNELPFFNFIKLFYEFGFYGVHVFFAISGFVFAYVYLESRQNTSFKEFSINRFSRLYPLHFATLLFVALIQVFYFLNYNQFQFGHIIDLYHFILQIFFVSAWPFGEGHSFNAPIWSVSLEIAIYIVFFSLISVFKKYEIKFSVALSLLLIFIDKSGVYDSLFLECARLFFSGVLVYYIVKSNFNYSLLFITSTILLIFSFIGNFKTYLFCPSLLLLFICFEKFIVNDKLKNIFSGLGNWTYALYLLHVPVQLTVVFLFKKLELFSNIFGSISFFFLYFIFLFFVSHLVYVFYEKPLNKHLRKFFLKNN